MAAHCNYTNSAQCPVATAVHSTAGLKAPQTALHKTPCAFLRPLVAFRMSRCWVDPQLRTRKGKYCRSLRLRQYNLLLCTAPIPWQHRCTPGQSILAFVGTRSWAAGCACCEVNEGLCAPTKKGLIETRGDKASRRCHNFERRAVSAKFLSGLKDLHIAALAPARWCSLVLPGVRSHAYVLASKVSRGQLGLG